MKQKKDFVGVENREYCPFVRQKTEELLIETLKCLNPKKILEIGTFLGYSASVMSEICPDAEILTVEKNEKNFYDAQKNLKEYQKISLVNADAYEFLETNQSLKFDFVFLDGPKGQYIKYLPFLKKMLNKNGVLFADDVLFYGLVNSNEKIEHKHRALVNNLRKFLDEIRNDSDFDTKIYDFDDGVSISKKKR